MRTRQLDFASMEAAYRYSDIAIGITTLNRPRLVEACGHSLKRVRGVEDVTLLITDDCSTDYEAAFVQGCFPAQASVQRNASNSGSADHACRAIVERLCGTNAKILIIVDSDLIFSQNCFDRTLKLIDASDGFFSLFNTPTHPATGEKNGFLAKKSVGAAGTVWRSDLARAMLAATPEGPVFDWRFCEYLAQQHKAVLCVKTSLVQHIGFAQGQNSSARGGDIGIGFTDDDAFNAYLMQQEIARAIATGFEDIAARADQQHSVLMSHMTALKGTFELLQQAQSQVAQLQSRVDQLETLLAALPKAGR